MGRAHRAAAARLGGEARLPLDESPLGRDELGVSEVTTIGRTGRGDRDQLPGDEAAATGVTGACRFSVTSSIVCEGVDGHGAGPSFADRGRVGGVRPPEAHENHGAAQRRRLCSKDRRRRACVVGERDHCQVVMKRARPVCGMADRRGDGDGLHAARGAGADARPREGERLFLIERQAVCGGEHRSWRDERARAHGATRAVDERDHRLVGGVRSATEHARSQ